MPRRSAHKRPHAHPPTLAPGHLPHALRPWQRRGLYGCVAALACTGLPWLLLHYTVGAGAGELPHPLEAWLMRLHGLAGFAALFLFGVMAGVHLPRGWHLSARPRWAGQRALGLAVSTLCALLALSAYALFYLVPEGWHDPVGWAHAGVGVALLVVLAWHVVRGRRASRR